MKPFVCLTLAGVLAVSVAPWALAAPRPAPVGWKTFTGEWFSVFYPANWKAARGQNDAALFSSPAGNAQFAVYSPLWNGVPSDLNFDPQREKRVARRIETSRAHDGANSQIRVRWETVMARNGSYTRSIVDVENTTLNTRRAFSFRYRDAATYRKFLPAFKYFKKSLEQYAD